MDTFRNDRNHITSKPDFAAVLTSGVLFNPIQRATNSFISITGTPEHRTKGVNPLRRFRLIHERLTDTLV
jgi:hypothetical protein